MPSLFIIIQCFLFSLTLSIRNEYVERQNFRFISKSLNASSTLNINTSHILNNTNIKISPSINNPSTITLNNLTIGEKSEETQALNNSEQIKKSSQIITEANHSLKIENKTKVTTTKMENVTDGDTLLSVSSLPGLKDIVNNGMLNFSYSPLNEEIVRIAPSERFSQYYLEIPDGVSVVNMVIFSTKIVYRE